MYFFDQFIINEMEITLDDDYIQLRKFPIFKLEKLVSIKSFGSILFV